MWVAHTSMTNINEWLTGFMGRQSWNYDARDLGVPEFPIIDGGRNPTIGVDM